MQKYIRLLLLLSLHLLVTGCSYTYIYHDEDCDHNNRNVNVSVVSVVNVVLDTDMPPFSPLAKETKQDEAATPDIRFIIGVYTQDGRLLEKRLITSSNITQTTYQINVTFALPNNAYRLVFWADYVANGAAKDWYYNTQDLREITFKGNDTANTEWKDAYTAYADINLRTRAGAQLIESITLKRPFAKYQIVAGDLEEYISKGGTNPESITTSITYLNPTYNSYDATEGQPGNLNSGGSFSETSKVLSTNHLLLGWNYLWAGDEVATLKAKVVIYDQASAEINTIDNLTIPYTRNKLTTVSGAFLTEKDDSGIGVITDYDGEINVPLP